MPEDRSPVFSLRLETNIANLERRMRQESEESEESEEFQVQASKLWVVILRRAWSRERAVTVSENRHPGVQGRACAGSDCPIKAP